MLSFVLALTAAAPATLAGREAVRVARLSAALGTNTALLTACWLACALGSGAAAWLGAQIGARLAPDGSAMMTVTALLVAAGDLALLRPARAPAEPTRSFAAIVIVLSTAQLTSAAGFLILAVTTAGMAAELAALAGMLGSGAVLTAAWRAGGAWETRLPLMALRWIVVGLLLLGAALSARGLLD